MDWVQLIAPGLGLAGVVLGGWLARRKTKTDTHSAVVADAVTYSTSLRADLAERDKRDEERDKRLDALERRMQERDRLARLHIRWDWRMMEKLKDAGIQLTDDPPPLFAYDD